MGLIVQCPFLDAQPDRITARAVADPLHRRAFPRNRRPPGGSLLTEKQRFSISGVAAQDVAQALEEIGQRDGGGDLRCIFPVTLYVLNEQGQHASFAILGGRSPP